MCMIQIDKERDKTERERVGGREEGGKEGRTK